MKTGLIQSVFMWIFSKQCHSVKIFKYSTMVATILFYDDWIFHGFNMIQEQYLAHMRYFSVTWNNKI